MIDYAPDNRLFVLTDGPELLAHDGDSEAPLWRTTLSAPPLALGQTATHVIAVAADGQILWFDRTDGRPAGQLHAGPLVAAASNRLGHFVALTPDGRLLGVNTGPTPLAHVATIHGGSLVALADDGRTFVAARGGAYELDARGNLVSKAATPPLQAAASRADGWFAAAGPVVLEYKRGQLTPFAEVPPTEAGTKSVHLGTGPAGVGVGVGKHFALYDAARPRSAPRFTAMYMDRVVTGVSFGPAPWVAVAMDLGDANKFNYETDATHRSDTHPGRKHNSWFLVTQKAKN